MNVRNLLFVVVLFLIWLAGYYYYSPQQSTSQPRLPEIEITQQAEPWTDTGEATPLEQDSAAILEPEKTTLTQAIAHEPLQQTAVSTPAQIIPMHKIKKGAKKRSKKAQKKQSLLPASAPTIDTLTQPASPQAHMTTPSSLNNSEPMISVTSSLVKKDIGYYKMLSWHYPYLFNLTVNNQTLFAKQDKKIIQEQAVPIPAHEPFVIRYNYEWHTPWGKRIGAKKVTFKPNTDAQQLSVAFKSNWKDEERIVVDGATKISAEALEEA